MCYCGSASCSSTVTQVAAMLTPELDAALTAAGQIAFPTAQLSCIIKGQYDVSLAAAAPCA